VRGGHSFEEGWPGIGVAAAGLIAGVVVGITTYQDSRQEINAFARVPVPGAMAMQVNEPGQQVVYYEGNRSVDIGDLVVSITDPVGAAVVIAPYEGELIYETPDLTLGRAIASFDAIQLGEYDVEVSGLDTGQVTVGESFARIALPGILAALAIAGLSLVAGSALWLVSILRR
jgi:hypothetical protein